jgi:GTP-binding protein HflX
MELPDGQQVLLTDTVGFVRKLPHDLVQSFRATLEEAALADFLIHVVDASAASAEKFLETTTEVLGEIGAKGKKTILCFNKVDLIKEPERRQELQHRHPDAVMISVKTGEGIEDLLHRIHEMVFDRVVRLDLRLPMDRLDLLALAHQEGKVLHEEYDEEVAVVQCVVPKRIASRFHAFATEKSSMRQV